MPQPIRGPSPTAAPANSSGNGAAGHAAGPSNGPLNGSAPAGSLPDRLNGAANGHANHLLPPDSSGDATDPTTDDLFAAMFENEAAPFEKAPPLDEAIPFAMNGQEFHGADENDFAVDPFAMSEAPADDANFPSLFSEPIVAAAPAPEAVQPPTESLLRPEPPAEVGAEIGHLPAADVVLPASREPASELPTVEAQATPVAAEAAAEAIEPPPPAAAAIVEPPAGDHPSAGSMFTPLFVTECRELRKRCKRRRRWWRLFG